MTKIEAATAFEAADSAWTAAVVALCGKDAGTLRYTYVARGEPGSELRALFDARAAAHNVWLEACNCGPAFPTELTPIGEQLVIPGCERRTTDKVKQLGLWG